MNTNYKFNTFGVIEDDSHPHKGWYIYIDTKVSPGSFYVYYTEHVLKFLGKGFDSWFPSKSELLLNLPKEINWLQESELIKIKKFEVIDYDDKLLNKKLQQKFKEEYEDLLNNSNKQFSRNT